MKRFLFGFVCFLLLSGQAVADVIELKSGRKVSGKIILQTKIFVRIDTFQMTDGRIKEFLVSNIERIHYGEVERTADPVLPEVKSKPSSPPAAVPPPDEIPPDQAPVDVPSKSGIRPAGQEMVPVDSVKAPEPVVETPASSASAAKSGQTSVDVKETDGTRKEPEQMPPPEEETGEEHLERQKKLDEIRHSQEYRSLKQMKNRVLLAVAGVVLFLLAVAGRIIAVGLDKTPGLPRSVGLLKRSAARLIDVTLGLFLFACIAAVAALLVPLDTFLGPVVRYGGGVAFLVWGTSMIAGPVTGIGTPGKRIMNLQVVQREGSKLPSVRQVFLRDVVLFFAWPLEIFVICFSRTKRRLGDAAASTVVRKREGRPAAMKLIPSLCAAGLLLAVGYFITPQIIRNTDSGRTAFEFMRRNFGEDEVTPPVGLRLAGAEAYAGFRLQDNHFGVYLRQEEGVWKVRRLDALNAEDVGRGLKIHCNRTR